MRLWSAAYEQLVDPPTVMPIVTELLNDDKWGHSSPGVPPPEHRGKVRLDHDNIHFRPGTNPDGGGSLHTGYSGPDCREHFHPPTYIPESGKRANVIKNNAKSYKQQNTPNDSFSNDFQGGLIL